MTAVDGGSEVPSPHDGDRRCALRSRDVEWIHVRFRLWFGEFLVLRPDPDPSVRVMFSFELQRRAALRGALVRTGYKIDYKKMTDSQFSATFPR